MLKTSCLVSMCVLAATTLAHAAGSESEVVESLLGRMTLEEKLGQLNQIDGRPSADEPNVPHVDEEQVRAGSIGSLLNVYGVEKTRRLQQIAVEESRLHVPLLFAHDVIHGFRTIFPVPLGAAASFDVAAVERSERVAATEATAFGIHWTFAPMVDVARDPRWGRIVEGAGEDPYLSSAMAAARVRGFQGHDLAANDTLMATAKHFVAYGAAEGGRDYNIADISAQTLHETYLAPFRAATRAGVQSVMAAFNEVAGMPMHANTELIQGVLRGQWGFDGIVVSDYNGIAELIDHGVAADRKAAGNLALRAGVDIDMVSGVYSGQTPSLLQSGAIAVGRIDEAVRRVLRAKYRRGLFDDPYRYCDPARERNDILTAANRAAARDLARESMVLLKNEHRVLPLSKQARTIAVVGPLAKDAASMLGSWSAAGREADVISPLQGIRSAVGPGTRVLYAKGVDSKSTGRSGIAEAVRIAREADVVLLFIGESHDMSGEARSRSSLALPGSQEALARALRATGKPMAAIVFAGRPLSISWLAENVSSILYAWFPGVEAGHALADVLFGAYSPAGRLPVSIPRSVGQVPIYYNHKNTGRPPQESVNNTSKYMDIPWTPLYPFGHGLSYTTFRYDNLRLSAPRIRANETMTVQVDVTNTGDRAGDEVAQLYLRDDVARVTRPVRELRGFERIHIEPGESRTLSFQLGPEELGFRDTGDALVVEPGTFTVFAGGSSAATLAAGFEVIGDR